MFADGPASHGYNFFHGSRFCAWIVALLIALACLRTPATSAATPTRLSALRRDVSYLFYHGFDGYMRYAFPEDELRPVTCEPFTRNFENQNDWELNDPLGDYSLTLIDSLSTLAILASSSESKQERVRSLARFQEGVQTIVELYGDGSDGPSAEGARSRGFDIDSKVQLFETTIRGLGGLLSAHLFAIGELPIRDYHPALRTKEDGAINWTKRFSYEDQLLRLAHDLGRRLLPAFSTQTGIPYPRVNLRTGIPFYRNAPQNCGIDDSEGGYSSNGQCFANPRPDDEQTETCSAGAGSLVLEFTTLSRLTGDDRFERLAKRAFWAVWNRRMPTGLVGGGIDAETGNWASPPSTGIGAGVDSFYEYAIKSYILLSGITPLTPSANSSSRSAFDPAPLPAEEEGAEAFLVAWQSSQQSIKRHVYQGENVVHPHYTQVNLFNAAQQAYWIDSLSAFYSGSLVLSGDIEEAAVTHLLFTALWARYSALPERWSTASGDIEHGLPGWPGRPEFIESAYYLYRATEDPWYVHVGEMTLRDMKRRCWTPCGWAGLEDVRTGELRDRMESFFLGETAKYLHLLFDPEHPLNKLDSTWVFSTEGHPLIIPKKPSPSSRSALIRSKTTSNEVQPAVCPRAPSPLPFTISRTAARPDLFHAAALARLKLASPDAQQGSALLESSKDNPGVTLDDVRSPTNRTFYPWTLPKEYVPPTGTCAPITEIPTYHITFPTPSTLNVNTPNHRTIEGIIMNNLAGIRLSMIQESRGNLGSIGSFRIHAINNQPLGRDEQLYVSRQTLSSVVAEDDPTFSRVRDSVNLQFVFDAPKPQATMGAFDDNSTQRSIPHDTAEMVAEKLAGASQEEQEAIIKALEGSVNTAEGSLASAIRYIAEKVSSKFSTASVPTSVPSFDRRYVNGITASGAGAAPLPSVPDAMSPEIGTGQPIGELQWKTIYHAGQLCDSRLPANIAVSHQVIVIKRGGCSFSEKLQKIPSYTPTKRSLQLVVLVSDPEYEEQRRRLYVDNGRDPSGLSFRPVLDQLQKTPSGLARRHSIPLIMIEGGDEVYDALKEATAFGIKRRYSIQAQGVPINNLHIL